MFKKYLFIAKNTFVGGLSDPGKVYTFFIGHFATIVTLLVFWGAVFRIYPNFKGYTYNTMVLYYVTLSLFSRLLSTGASAKAIQEQINKGSLSFRLLNPISWNVRTLISGIVSRVSTSISGILFFIIITFIFNTKFIGDLQRVIVFIVALIFAILLNYYLYAIIGIISFYTIDNWGYRSLFGRISDLAGGKIFPLDMLPTDAVRVFTFLPFSYSTFFVLQIYLNKISITDTLSQLVVQFSWVIIVILLYGALFNKGMKHYESVGI